MTLAEFMREYREAARHLRPVIEFAGELRCHHPTLASFGTCPVAVVANRVRERRNADPRGDRRVGVFGNGDWQDAADYMGLARLNAYRIVRAGDWRSDDLDPKEGVTQRQAERAYRRHAALRRTLMLAGRHRPQP